MLEQLEKPTREPKSFDLLASVDMYRFDMMVHGEVLPETEQRVHDEELTYIAEGINRPLYTQFVLQERDGELVYFDRGTWASYISTLERGNEVAELEAMADQRKAFTAKRTAEDLQYGYRMRELKPGQGMAWASKFPDQECNLYGEAFVASLGYQPMRRMGFLYYAEKLDDGSLVLHTQSVDNSNVHAFDAALSAGQNGVVAMRERYDEALAQSTGAEHYAGRRVNSVAPKENAWEIIKIHKDLLRYYFDGIKDLAGSSLPRTELEVAKKRLTYGVWAALKERIDRDATSRASNYVGYGYDFAALHNETRQAYTRLSKRGEVLMGCGSSLSPDSALMDADVETVRELVFGGKSEVMKCVTCPLCKRSGVDAHIKHEVKSKTITCSKCKKSKTYAK